MFKKMFFLIKYLIPFRRLKLIIECKEEAFLYIIDYEIYDEKNKTINKDKNDFAFIGSIDKNEKTIKIC